MVPVWFLKKMVEEDKETLMAIAALDLVDGVKK